ncbi:lysozyme inhibitor LprI family protein [Peristeroidobacter soli]|uniref:lysozyme inhibitor LprI family protein n=1 Tax=Peristeroidobacter soli TaxID=2497877 RepID=UPI00101BE43C|nr:lysozyme inhibitor LprI family protein [Peristeroidobacter soli]
MHKVARFCALLLVSHLSSAANAACTDFSRPVCRLEALLETDGDLNAVYSKVLGTRSESERGEVRAGQRKWLRSRDQTCELGNLSQRGDWMKVLSSDPDKFNCVYATTRARLDELRKLPTGTLDDLAELTDRRETTFPVSHSSGKWYAEISFLAKGNDQADKEYVQVAVTDGESLAGTQVMQAEMRRLADANGEYVVSLAIDLDNRVVYWGENGQWRGGEPGSVNGIKLNPGKRYSIRVISGRRSITRDLHLGFLRINTGRDAFRYQTPAAYQAFYVPPSNAEEKPPVEWIVPYYQRTAGETLPIWAERYWVWLMSHSRERNPTQDITGDLCGANQNGPVWFLAGGDAKARINRRCTVPQGKYILLPAFAQLMTSRLDAPVPISCTQFESQALAANGSGAIQADFIVLDGQRFDALYDYRPYTPQCVTIRGGRGETVVKDAIFYGTWVMLQPLPPGDHTISFGGELPALNTYRNVTYKIHIE